MSERHDSYDERRREMRMDGKHVDRRPGNGSGEYEDEAYDGENPEDVYRASDAATTFSGSEDTTVTRSDGTTLSFDTLFQIHHDNHPMTNDGAAYKLRQDEQWIADTIDIIASQLELTDRQRQRLNEYVETADLEDAASLSVEELLLAATTLACNKDDRWLRREDEYIQLQSDFGVTNERIKVARQFFRETVM